MATVMQLIDESLAVLAEREARVDATEQVEFTDGQLKVCSVLLNAPDSPWHVYGIQQALKKKYEGDRPLSERAITNVLKRLMELGLVEKDSVLRPNSLGPARQEYQLVDPGKARQLMDLETKRRLELLQSTVMALAPVPNPVSPTTISRRNS